MRNDVPADLAGASVLVTGGAGFIGSHLAERLAGNCRVTVLDDLSTGDPAAVPEGATLVRGDVRDPADVTEAVRGTDVVFHQAALPDVTETVRSPVESHRRNATGAVTVLDAARREDARVVFASSAAVYGQPRSLPIDESDRKTPTSPYGIDKLAADQHARAYADLYGLPTVSLRYFNVYGPGRTAASGSGVVNAFLERARDGETLVVHGDGSQTRDFVHVSDVVDANLRAATTDHVGLAYNVGTGDAVSVREVADRVTRTLGSGSDVVHGEPRDGDIQHSRASIDRARLKLGFDPTYDFAAGLETMVRVRDHPT
ncbi:MAG: NAD-dependent epimerase/dehydratase family protein [Haloarculaceae archaeon]